MYTPPRHRAAGSVRRSPLHVRPTRWISARPASYLFTDLANPTSNSIYHRIGYRPVRDHQTVRFEA
ncbi:MAG: hypothetical protein M3P83_13395 [Actinomycetota bacterium]|nr:hypothetical protein [Actinomycetota bacterium]